MTEKARGLFGRMCDKLMLAPPPFEGYIWPPESGESRPDETPATRRVQEFGLRLPNGTVVWPPTCYKGHGIDTPDDRAQLLAVLKKTAADLDFVEREFLAHYRWITRDAVLGILPVTSLLAYETEEQEIGRDGNDAKHEGIDPGASVPSRIEEGTDQEGTVIADAAPLPTNGDSGGATGR